jgi:asparagine synthase (glutamine-hydrolysing)
MCGISGIIDYNQPPSEPLLRRMIGFLRHRGPDAFGLYLDRAAGLAHARLSIIDLSGGDQPIHNENKTLWIVYNGEVFNYPELRQDLITRGHQFYTRTDTEILVHLYEEYGPEMLSKLNGQFALALWDLQKKQLFLARDRMGIRPLFYKQDGGLLVFASEIKSIFADPTTQRTLDPKTLSDVFTCWSPLGAETAFKGINQIPPGHYGIFSPKGLSVNSYWKLPYSSSINEERKLSEWTEELKDLLYDATRIRLRADVPVGAYLSGGLDSTYTTSLVKRFFNNELRTFSVSFTDERFDEAQYQEKAVNSLRTNHSSIRCTENDIGVSFPEVIWHTEVPLLRTAPAPMYRLARLVRENQFKVVLTGEGSDEIFGGYDIFKEDKIRRFCARRPESGLRPRLFSRLYPDIFTGDGARALSFVKGFFQKNLTEVDSPFYSHLIRWENTAQIKRFFSESLKEELINSSPFSMRYAALLPPDFTSWDPLSRAQFTEMELFLSNYLLSSQGDRMAMAHSVEGRFPFLDYRVVEFACRVPPRFRMNGLKEKFLLRRAAAGLIPDELAQRPKQPYRAPISRCFLGKDSPEYATELLSEQSIRETGYFDPIKVHRLVQKGENQKGFLLSERENMALIGIISTQLLHKQFIDNFPLHPSSEIKEFNVYVNKSR